ncbi:hypothetical protein [Polyangium aurulentum]|uniref:hypothetical protein n=1 Tax=Polyangium aurulentum TaxID=2567896 RepID=UPI0011377334|nr:hypothetical protein [Polyangium aurulentum]UQA54908.1 hypothetical protein E8A73_026475 [Polyangium aurulentum]
MHERSERMVTALLDDIRRGVKLARVPGGEPREAQPVGSFAQERDALPALLPTHFECRVELPIAQAIETIKLWGELDPSGALVLQGMEVESRSSS